MYCLFKKAAVPLCRWLRWLFSSLISRYEAGADVGKRRPGSGLHCCKKNSPPGGSGLQVARAPVSVTQLLRLLLLGLSFCLTSRSGGGAVGVTLGALSWGGRGCPGPVARKYPPGAAWRPSRVPCFTILNFTSYEIIKLLHWRP